MEVQQGFVLPLCVNLRNKNGRRHPWNLQNTAREPGEEDLVIEEFQPATAEVLHMMQSHRGTSRHDMKEHGWGPEGIA
jgi:hypothetical protein